MNYAVEAGADAEALTLCLEEGSSAARVRRQLATARGLGVAGTPTFLLGRIQDDGSIRVFDRIVGSQPIEAFRAAVERAEGWHRPRLEDHGLSGIGGGPRNEQRVVEGSGRSSAIFGKPAVVQWVLGQIR